MDSSVAKFTYHAKDHGVNETLLFEIIKGTFAHRRKNILNSLSEGFPGEDSKKITKERVKEILKTAGIDEKVRAEELLLKDFIRLAELFSNFSDVTTKRL